MKHFPNSMRSGDGWALHCVRLNEGFVWAALMSGPTWCKSSIDASNLTPHLSANTSDLMLIWETSLSLEMLDLEQIEDIPSPGTVMMACCNASLKIGLAQLAITQHVHLMLYATAGV